ncbi:hypothetical protein Cabys_4006 [Caldithrix abyssi DSM 13497]|uniref:Uncharacterized protein n=1 Tax=Caldithrix abyssi DSM 13497 TaxID=880073 RepID=A0A1J1CDJ5_CALAY|nr:hypothetical protein Cabys_4006 [Caldithrix abyssi DSM 13497]
MWRGGIRMYTIFSSTKIFKRITIFMVQSLILNLKKSF